MRPLEHLDREFLEDLYMRALNKIVELEEKIRKLEADGVPDSWENEGGAYGE